MSYVSNFVDENIVINIFMNIDLIGRYPDLYSI